MGRDNLDVYEAAVRALAGRVVGSDADAVGEIHESLWTALRYRFGTKGIGVTAAAALESAAWDLLGKQQDMSVSSILGRRRDRVPAYVDGSLWHQASVAQLQAEAAAWVTDGVRAIKMRAGMHGVEEDAKRISAVRQAIGLDVDLMVDCHQLMGFGDALALGRRIEELDLAWIEDPLDVRDLEGHARLAAELDTPIATGENEYGVHGFRALLDMQAADIVLVDRTRVGGVRDFVSVAELAASRDVAVVNHCTPEQGLQVLAAAPQARYVDQLTWWQPLYNERLEFDAGDCLVPDRPGFGFTFVDDVVDRFGI